MRFINFAFVLVLISALFAENIAQSNQMIEAKALTLRNKVYHGIGALVGSGNEKNQEKAYFRLDLGLKNTIIGDKSTAQWGIDCSATAENSCSVTDATIKDEYYFSRLLKTQQASLYLRLDQENKLNVTDPELAKMDARLVTGGNKWVLENWGILGLSPQGSFAKFISKTYGDKASLLLSYKAKDKQATNEELIFDFKAVLNPQFNETQVIKKFEIESTRGSWSAVGSLYFISEAFSFKNAKICFNSVNDEIIQVPDSLDRCDAVKKLICDGKIGPDCKKDMADLSKAPVLELNFDGVKFSFEPKDYIFYRGDVVDCRFGDVGNLRADESCDPDTELAVGKLFLEKYIPVLSFNFGGKSSITLLSEFNIPDDKKTGGRLFWIMLGAFAALVALVVIIMVILKKKQESDDDYYPGFNNTA